MAKRKKHSKAPKRKVAPARSKARKVAKTAKGAVAKAKPKRAPVKKAARKVKQPVAEQPAPGVITVTEVEETEIRKAS